MLIKKNTHHENLLKISLYCDNLFLIDFYFSAAHTLFFITLHFKVCGEA